MDILDILMDIFILMEQADNINSSDELGFWEGKGNLVFILADSRLWGWPRGCIIFSEGWVLSQVLDWTHCGAPREMAQTTIEKR